MRVADLPLPPHRHIPGQNERPDEAFFNSVKEESDKAWLYGIRLFNAGFYWEAHEVLEPVWLNASPNSRERYLVQAVIHLANGLLKETMGRPNARRRLAGLAHGRLVEAFPEGRGRLMCIEAADLFAAADKLAEGDIEIRLNPDCEI
jgi:predicted metal-dependent hydrolase